MLTTTRSAPTENPMARNYYSEINLHIVWHTKLSRPMLRGDVETAAHRALQHRLVKTPGAYVHEIGGTDTHVHLAVTIAPTVNISELVGRLKGGSAHDVNQRLGNKSKVLQWQEGYGVVSFGTRDLEWVREYIRNQREHHAQGKVHDRLERIAQREEG
jgi:putative transposase